MRLIDVGEGTLINPEHIVTATKAGFDGYWLHLVNGQEVWVNEEGYLRIRNALLKEV